MRIEICQPDELDNTTDMFEVQVDGVIRGRFWNYPAGEQFADFLAAELPSPLVSAGND